VKYHSFRIGLKKDGKKDYKKDYKKDGKKVMRKPAERI